MLGELGELNDVTLEFFRLRAAYTLTVDIMGNWQQESCRILLEESTAEVRLYLVRRRADYDFEPVDGQLLTHGLEVG